MSSPLSVVILAAGFGTRMKSQTTKVLHRAGGLPLVEHVVRTALTLAPPERIVTVVGHQAERVAAAVAPYRVHTALQEEPRGTGHALRCAREAAPVDGHLVVLYGDVPLLSEATLARLVMQQVSSSAAATVLTAELADPAAYGRIIRGEDGGVEAIVEYKAASDAQRGIREINSGIYCFDAALLWQHIDSITTNNPAGEFYLTDMVEILRAHGHRVDGQIMADSSELLGINTKVELAEVDRLFRLRKATQLMLDGVTIERPETVAIDNDALIGPDSVIEPNTRILGKTTIGSNARIGTGSIVTNSVIADSVIVEPYCVIDNTVIGAGSHIGPFARLRLKNQVGNHVHIGNFVELKNTAMADGAKANHLAYLGDSVIGSNTNIGAGVITCNYDGNKKHPTVIGDRVFVGSNSTLVAPITVEPDSYVGAGSVITEQVPGGALALGRGRQVIKEGWVERKKQKQGE
ncbi:MAG TPA: bifunctional UDP-N-acetylglucosamine diphosphorylase/glucosamine-1-phosphate N-acetyltransferase GlmU [Bryobacteraceae bacterium]|nr:bifunctional UDP-N-acetylglucosamine diphosphorylase/glucosamine-1-phosphate N-acetyltransferase GlmU [Bryobacteraceae bacterium]